MAKVGELVYVAVYVDSELHRLAFINLSFTRIDVSLHRLHKWKA